MASLTENSLGRLFRTVRHLKGRQIYYRIYYAVRDKWPRKLKYEKKDADEHLPANPDIQFPVLLPDTYQGGDTFCFLNQKKSFDSGVNWNFMSYGQLWNYNLLYFEYLMQAEIPVEKNRALIHDFINSIEEIKGARDPYPISLRCINWIKFLIQHNLSDSKIIDSLRMQYEWLSHSVEYHLLGNHLFENGCALYFGGLYLDDERLLKQGKKILQSQIEEQVLADGAHFERSPMYHQTLLYRLLDVYNLTRIKSTDDEVPQHLRHTIKRMLGWLQYVTFSNGKIPHVNDATDEIAPNTHALKAYAAALAIETEATKAGASGYRMIKTETYDLFIDAADIGPDYIPGHAHSDTFSFILHLKNKPFIVDTGVSTYEEGSRRQVERSTAAHNTVRVNEKEQTEIWKSFRVGRRAHVTRREEGSNYIIGEHNGYEKMGLTHRRIFKWGPRGIYIKDMLTGKRQATSAAYLHFHPDVEIEERGDRIFANDVQLLFIHYDEIQISSYQHAEGFNKLRQATVIKIRFEKELETRIQL